MDNVPRNFGAVAASRFLETVIFFGLSFGGAHDLQVETGYTTFNGLYEICVLVSSTGKR